MLIVTLKVTLTSTKMKETRKYKTTLRNGCSRTEVFISPKNYNSLKSKTDLKKDWFVECRFYDPLFLAKYPNGFQFRKRPPKQETLSAQKNVMKKYKGLMETYLDLQHFNPITKRFMVDESGLLSPTSDFKSALFLGLKKITGTKKHIAQVEYAVIRFTKGLDDLAYSFLNISDVKIHHIKNTLEYLKLPDNYYNKFRSYIMGIFKELIQYGCINHNPLREISKKKCLTKPRMIFSDTKLQIVFNYLKNNYYDFYRYGKIFFYSGGRSTELLRVQKKHVDIENQEYVVEIQKGKHYVWEVKVITDEALPYWKEIIGLCSTDEDYLFTVKQMPGKTPIQSAAITRRWNRLVKSKKIKDENGNEISVTEDFYSLKHLFLEKIEEKQQNNDFAPIINLAQIAGSHTTNRTTGIYAIGRKKRENEILKKVRVGI